MRLTKHGRRQRNAWPQIYEEDRLDSELANQLHILTSPTMILVDARVKAVNRNVQMIRMTICDSVSSRVCPTGKHAPLSRLNARYFRLERCVPLLRNKQCRVKLAKYTACAKQRHTLTKNYFNRLLG